MVRGRGSWCYGGQQGGVCGLSSRQQWQQLVVGCQGTQPCWGRCACTIVVGRKRSGQVRQRWARTGDDGRRMLLWCRPCTPAVCVQRADQMANHWRYKQNR